MANEKRLIDANALLKKEKWDFRYQETLHYVRVIDIEDAPTVDAVEVVRCKDCKSSRKLNNNESLYLVDECLICTNCEATDHGWNPVFQHISVPTEKGEPTMDVREKLVEILRKPIFPHELVDPIEAVADYLLDSGVTVQEWISVKDRLPERNAEALVCDIREDYVSIWKYMGDGLWFGDEAIWATEDISHWMPLPQPPKGE